MFKILAATAALSLAALSANAATVAVSGTPDAPVANSFAADLTAAGATVFLAPADIVVGVGGARLTFTAVAAESGFNNSFVSAAGTLSESGDFNDFNNALAASNSSIFTAGSLAGLLKFASSGASDALLGLDARFAIYASGVGNLSTFFLAFDDQDGGSVDDNHDDFIVRVDVSAVPLPAGGLLLIGALGGLAALRRRMA